MHHPIDYDPARFDRAAVHLMAFHSHILLDADRGRKGEGDRPWRLEMEGGGFRLGWRGRGER